MKNKIFLTIIFLVAILSCQAYDYKYHYEGTRGGQDIVIFWTPRLVGNGVEGWYGYFKEVSTGKIYHVDASIYFGYGPSVLNATVLDKEDRKIEQWKLETFDGYRTLRGQATNVATKAVCDIYIVNTKGIEIKKKENPQNNTAAKSFNESKREETYREKLAKLWKKKKYKECYELAMGDPNDSMAQFYLGRLYYSGKYVTQDFKKALEWFEISELQGNTLAQTYIGEAYFKGNGVKRNYKKAVEWFEKAALVGNIDAINWMGDCYFKGKGVKKNHEKAIEWYTKGAEKGSAVSMNKLGDVYVYGKYSILDYQKGLEWYLKGAELGNADAQTGAGLLYEYYKDYNNAIDWLLKAEKQGHKGARKALERLHYY